MARWQPGSTHAAAANRTWYCWGSRVESSWWESTSDTCHYGILNRSLAAQCTSDFKVALWIVHQEIPLGHVLWDSESIHHAVDHFFVSGWLPQVMQLLFNSGQVCNIAPEGVSRLDGAVKLGLEPLDMVHGVVLVGVCQSGQGGSPKTIFMPTDAACNHIGCI